MGKTTVKAKNLAKAEETVHLVVRTCLAFSKLFVPATDESGKEEFCLITGNYITVPALACENYYNTQGFVKKFWNMPAQFITYVMFVGRGRSLEPVLL